MVARQLGTMTYSDGQISDLANTSGFRRPRIGFTDPVSEYYFDANPEPLLDYSMCHRISRQESQAVTSTALKLSNLSESKSLGTSIFKTIRRFILRSQNESYNKSTKC